MTKMESIWAKLVDHWHSDFKLSLLCNTSVDPSACQVRCDCKR